MRRFDVSKMDHETLGKWEAEPPSPSLSLLRYQFTLDVITPPVGGGVTPFEPDTTDIIRVPSIKGHLRAWWRRMQSRDEIKNRPGDLFQKEARIWGGVGVKGVENGEETEKSLASPVGLRVEILAPGSVRPSGRHPWDGLKLKSLPEWETKALGYALFPLQIPQEERNRRYGSGDLPTRSYRTEVKFRLDVTLKLGAGGLGEGSAQEVLRSLWLWMNLGGIGARTRRGFGALALVGAQGPGVEIPEEWKEAVEQAKALFSSGSADPTRLNGILGAWNLPASSDLSLMEVWKSPTSPSRGIDAQGELVGLLRTFRQGEGVGRDPGKGTVPGHTRWPEADLLRKLLLPGGERAVVHSSPDEKNRGAPRAAFGLPIQFQFKSSQTRQEPREVVEILPMKPTPNGDKDPTRWPSPLFLRPMRVKEGVVPVVFILGEPPSLVRVKSHSSIKVQTPTGSRPVIQGFLNPKGGNALQAFVEWLRKDQRYARTRP